MAQRPRNKLYLSLLWLTVLLAVAEALMGVLGLLWGGLASFSVISFGAMFGMLLALAIWKPQPRVSLWVSGLCALAVWAELTWHNHKLCAAGPCQTDDPMLLVVTTLVQPPVLLSLLAWAFLLAAWRIRLLRRRRVPRTRI